MLKKAFLLFLLVNACYGACIDEFTGGGAVCTYSTYTVYADSNTFCGGGHDHNSVPDYCKVADCPVCVESKLKTCFDELADQKLFVRAEYTGSLYNIVWNSLGTKAEKTECKITKGESCYRDNLGSQLNDSFWDNYQVHNNSPDDFADLCCNLEAIDRYDFDYQGCDSKGNYHNNVYSFGNAWCRDRTLTFKDCGMPGCGAAQGCVSDCEAAIPKDGPICDLTDFTSYANRAAFCNSVNSGNDLINYCRVGNCTVCDSSNSDLVACQSNLANKDVWLKQNFTATAEDPVAKSYTGKCKIRDSEWCYRHAVQSTINDSGWAKYSQSGSSGGVGGTENDEECCIFECYDQINHYGDIYDGNGVYYDNYNTFCKAWCNNRGLGIRNCSGDAAECQAICNAQFTSEGPVCDLSTYTLYNSVSEFCASDNSHHKIFSYCKVADCTLCTQSTELDSLKDSFSTQDNEIALIYTADDNNNSVLTYEGKCRMTEAEYNYRSLSQSTLNDPYFTNYTLSTETLVNTEPLCCMFECYDRFDLNVQGCGSDGNFYTDIEALCSNWCNNRSITLSDCFTSGCGAAQGCEDLCQKTITGDNSICDYSDWSSYANKQEFCSSANKNNFITDYCKVGDCSVCDNNNGALVQCKSDQGTSGDLLVMDYQADTNQNLSSPHEGKCIITMGEKCYRDAIQSQVNDQYWANYAEHSKQTGFSRTRCCVFECLERVNITGDLCATDGVAYSSYDTFCEAWCDNRSLTLLDCGSTDCSTNSQCEQMCENTLTTNPPFCGNNYSFYDSIVQYCTDKNNGTVSSIIKCDDNTCTEDECNIMKCESLNTSITGKVCLQTAVNLKKHFDSVRLYCEAAIATNMPSSSYAISSNLNCGGSECATIELCDAANCEITTDYRVSCIPVYITSYFVFKYLNSCLSSIEYPISKINFNMVSIGQSM